MYSRHIEAEIYYASEIVFVSFATRRHVGEEEVLTFLGHGDFESLP